MIIIILTDGTKVTTPKDRYIARVGDEFKITHKGRVEKTIKWNEIAGIQES